MSRLEFEDRADFIEWLEARHPSKYELYRTPKRVIAVPTVSTRPVLYGALNVESYDSDTIDSMVIEMVERGYGPAFRVKSYSFDDSRAERRDDAG